MKKILKIVAVLAVIAIVLLAALFFYINSGAFLKGQVLPRIAGAIKMPVTAEGAKFSIFSIVELQGFKVGEGATPLLQARTIRLRHRLMPLFSGNVIVDEVLLDGLQVHVVEQADGSLNLPTAEEPAGPARPAAGGGTAPTIAIRNVKLQDVGFTYVKLDANGQPVTEIDLSGVQLTLPELVSGQPFELQIKAVIAAALNGDRLRVEDCHLDLKGSLPGDLGIKDFSGFEMAAALGGISGSAGPLSLDGRRVDLTFKNNQLRLSESLNGTDEATATVDLPATLSPPAGKIGVHVDVPNSSVLNLIGQLAGDYDFGQTKLSYQADIDLQPEGAIAAAGQLQVRNLTITSAAAGMTALAPMSIDVEHDLGVKGSESVTLSALAVGVEAGGQKLLSVKLDKPATIALGATSGADLPSAELHIVSEALDLMLFKAMMPLPSGIELLGGVVRQDLKVAIHQGGARIEMSGTTDVDDFGVQIEDLRFEKIAVRKQHHLELRDMQQLTISGTTADILVAGQQALHAAADVKFDLKSGTGSATLRDLALTPAAAGLIPAALRDSVPIDNLNLAGQIAVALAAAGSHLDMALKARDLKINPGPDYTVPPVSLDLGLKALLAPDGMLAIESLALQLKDQAASLLDVTVNGTVDTAMQSRRSQLDIASRAPVDLDRIMAMLPATSEEEKPEPEEAKTPLAPLPLWLVLNATATEITYKQMRLDSVAATVVHRDAVFTVDPCTFTLNGGKTTLTAHYGYAGEPITYDLKLDTAGLGFEPVFASFVPGVGKYLSGGMNQLSLEFNGAGTDWDTLSKVLTAKLNFDLRDLAVGGLDTKVSTTMGLIGMKPSNLTMNAGGGKLSIADGVLTVPELTLKGEDMMLALTGTLGLNDLDADLAFTRGYKGQPPSSFLTQGIALTENADGYRAAKPTQIKGKLTDWSVITKSLLGEAIPLNLDGAAGAAVGEVLKSGGDVKKAVGGLLGGAFGGGQPEAKPDGDAPAEGQTEEPEKKAAKKLIKGLFGN